MDTKSLPVNSLVADEYPQYSYDAQGKEIFRHVIVTDWQLVEVSEEVSEVPLVEVPVKVRRKR